jgi:SEC-C motif
MTNPPTAQAFTCRFKGRSPRLITEVHIFPAFDPTKAPPPSQIKCLGLYDTGATNSVISPRIVEELKLSSIGAKTVGVGGGSLITSSHLVNIGLPNGVLFGMAMVSKMTLPGDIDVLIGMDILGMGDFAVTHHGGKTVFSFCVPSQREIDFVAENQKKASQKTNSTIAHVSRNATCPCGSGKKYKGCHGRLT